MSPKNHTTNKKKNQEWKVEWAKPPENNKNQKIINGKAVNWYQKCNGSKGGQTTSHFTEGHTGPTNKISDSMSNNTKLELNDDLKAVLMTLNLDTKYLGLN